MKKDIFSKLYVKYKYNLFPKIKHVRGATRFLKILDKLSQRKIEKIDENEVQGIFEKEWDNLIIIDACRHDLYEEVYGKTQSRYTVASCSKNFFKKTFSDGNFEDIVYISANPHIDDQLFEQDTGRKASETFHSVYETYKTDWDDEAGTVRPEPVVRDAKTAEKLFPEKRKIIHFMQPHHPFLDFKFESAEIGGFHQYAEWTEDKENEAWVIAEKGNLDVDELWEAYKNNLSLVMQHVDELEQELEGKTVVTADHGNLFNENGRFAHPCNSKAKPLRSVPWIEL